MGTDNTCCALRQMAPDTESLVEAGYTRAAEFINVWLSQPHHAYLTQDEAVEVIGMAFDLEFEKLSSRKSRFCTATRLLAQTVVLIVKVGWRARKADRHGG